MKATKKQVFKGNNLTLRKTINNIIKFYELASVQEIQDGMQWYNTANDYAKELASRFNISTSQAAGLISVFSPQTSWAENKRFALTYLLNRKRITKTRVQTLKAHKILTLKSESDIYQAQSTNGKAFKTKAFFLNIANPDIVTSVTIDRHAIAISIQSPDNVAALPESYGSNVTLAQYNFFEAAYIKAAAKLDILPHQLQAITWVVYRRLRDLKKHDTNNEWVPFMIDIEF